MFLQQQKLFNDLIVLPYQDWFHFKVAWGQQ